MRLKNIWKMGESSRQPDLLYKLPNEILILIGTYLTSKDKVIDISLFSSIFPPNQKVFLQEKLVSNVYILYLNC